MKTRKRVNSLSAGQRAFLRAYTPFRAAILERDKYRCRFCLAAAPSLEIHHVVRRSQNTALKLDANNCLALCIEHHARTDYPYAKGRLQITAEGGGAFTFVLRYATDKFAARSADELGSQR